MKRHFYDRRCWSFTLVELLVVIAIIAILASVILAAGSGAIKAALRTKAQTMTTQIQTACLSYYNDYGVYPLSTNPAPTAQVVFGSTPSDQANWSSLIWALCGNINDYSPSSPPSPLNVPNTRGITYLSLNKSSIDSHGIPLNPIPPSSTLAPYFNISMDPTYSGILGTTTPLPIFSPGSMSAGTMAGGIYVWANCNPAVGASNVNWWVHAP